VKAIVTGLCAACLLAIPAVAFAGQIVTPKVSAPQVNAPHTDPSQTLNIGSQSKGAGAGKITFNPFQITRKTDQASPTFFSQSGK